MIVQRRKKLNREINQLITQYNIINEKLNQVELVLDDLQERDDNIYRVIFEADPIPKSIMKAGYGGVNRYQNLNGYKNSELILSTTKKLIKLQSNFIYNQNHLMILLNWLKTNLKC